MFDEVLTIARIGLLIAGACAVAVWAVRQPDRDSALLKRLTAKRNKRGGE